MNGISSNLKEELKKSTLNKKREKLKFLSAILISNALVAMLCLPSQDERPLVQKKRELHAGFQLLELNINPLLALEDSKGPHFVTLLASDKKVLVQKAWLHEEVIIKDSSLQQKRRFKIEIPENELLKLSALADEIVIAVPHMIKVQTTKKVARGSQYEINL